MRSLFYPRLALSNLKNNSQVYGPFLLACVGTLMMFYNIVALAQNESVKISGSLVMLLQAGCFFTAVFSVILLLYTSSFVLKRRLREFGVFNILGMDKPNISRMLVWETVFLAVATLSVGLVLGVVSNGLFTLLLQKLLAFDPHYTFAVDALPLGITALLFLGIFALVLASSLWKLWRFRPTELLRDASAGEREPKTKWLLTLVGIVTLGAGYWIAQTIDSPMASFMGFQVSVLLVIVGTYCLFIAGSIAVLKLLRRNKKYYYQTNHFTAVSGMLYRMKKNAAGLASICLLLTAIVVMISTTLSLYVGMQDALKTRFPRDMQFTVWYDLESELDPQALEGEIYKTVQSCGRTVESYHGKSYFQFLTIRKGQSYEASTDDAMLLGMAVDPVYINVLFPQEYARLTGKTAELAPNEILVHDNHKKVGDSLTLLGSTYRVQPMEDEQALVGEAFNRMVSHVLTIVMPTQEAYLQLYEQQAQIFAGMGGEKMRYQADFDVDGTPEQEVELVFAFWQHENENLRRMGSRQESHASFFEMYGILLFLGLFLGGVALMGMVLIIYYKQVAEGVEDRRRFAIMQQVGMSRWEVKKVIHSQILSVFALPLVVAAIHVTMAFPLLTKMLAMLNLMNAGLFALCAAATMVFFALVYLVVYLCTAKVYYRIVHT